MFIRSAPVKKRVEGSYDKTSNTSTARTTRGEWVKVCRTVYSKLEDKLELIARHLVEIIKNDEFSSFTVGVRTEWGSNKPCEIEDELFLGVARSTPGEQLITTGIRNILLQGMLPEEYFDILMDELDYLGLSRKLKIAAALCFHPVRQREGGSAFDAKLRLKTSLLAAVALDARACKVMAGCLNTLSKGKVVDFFAVREDLSALGFKCSTSEISDLVGPKILQLAPFVEMYKWAHGKVPNGIAIGYYRQILTISKRNGDFVFCGYDVQGGKNLSDLKGVISIEQMNQSFLGKSSGKEQKSGKERTKKGQRKFSPQMDSDSENENEPEDDGVEAASLDPQGLDPVILSHRPGEKPHQNVYQENDRTRSIKGRWVEDIETKQKPQRVPRSTPIDSYNQTINEMRAADATIMRALEEASKMPSSSSWEGKGPTVLSPKGPRASSPSPSVSQFTWASDSPVISDANAAALIALYLSKGSKPMYLDKSDSEGYIASLINGDWNVNSAYTLKGREGVLRIAQNRRSP